MGKSTKGELIMGRLTAEDIMITLVKLWAIQTNREILSIKIIHTGANTPGSAEKEIV